MDRKIKISIFVYNRITAGLSAAKRGFLDVSKWFVSRTKWMAVQMAAVLSGAGNLIRRSMSAWGLQDFADKQMMSVLNAYGEAGDKLLPIMRAYAKQIRDETGATQHYVLAGMARMRMLGVETRKLKEAARAMIGVKTAGLDGARAQKVVAMAMQGDYQMLMRYVPMLRQLSTQQQKAAYTANFFEMGYDTQKQLMGSLMARFSQFKAYIHDAMKEVGRTIDDDSTLIQIFERINLVVKNVGDNIRSWVDSSSGIAKMRSLLEGVLTLFDTSKDTRVGVLKAGLRAIRSEFTGIANNFVEIVSGNAKRIGMLIASEFIAVVERNNPIGLPRRGPSGGWMPSNTEDTLEAVRRVAATGTYALLKEDEGGGFNLTKTQAYPKETEDQMWADITAEIKNIRAERARESYLSKMPDLFAGSDIGTPDEEWANYREAVGRATKEAEENRRNNRGTLSEQFRDTPDHMKLWWWNNPGKPLGMPARPESRGVMPGMGGTKEQEDEWTKSVREIRRYDAEYANLVVLVKSHIEAMKNAAKAEEELKKRREDHNDTLKNFHKTGSLAEDRIKEIEKAMEAAKERMAEIPKEISQHQTAAEHKWNISNSKVYRYTARMGEKQKDREQKRHERLMRRAAGTSEREYQRDLRLQKREEDRKRRAIGIPREGGLKKPVDTIAVRRARAAQAELDEIKRKERELEELREQEKKYMTETKDLQVKIEANTDAMKEYMNLIKNNTAGLTDQLSPEDT